MIIDDTQGWWDRNDYHTHGCDAERTIIHRLLGQIWLLCKGLQDKSDWDTLGWKKKNNKQKIKMPIPKSDIRHSLGYK